MPRFSARSLAVRSQLHPLLVLVVDECIKEYDFTLVQGYRGEADQNKAHAGGFSNAKFGQSPHNYKPSFAFDAYSWPIDVNDTTRQKPLADAMKRAADRARVHITWGGDFKSFKDRPHFELTHWRLLRNV